MPANLNRPPPRFRKLIDAVMLLLGWAIMLAPLAFYFGI